MTHEESVTTQKFLWAEMLAQRRADLVQSGADRFLDIHDREKAHETLERLYRRYTQKGTSSCLLKMAPLFERLTAFTSAITALSAGPAAGGMIWGATLIALECAMRLTGLVDQISECLTTLAVAMPRFEQYISLYPSSLGLKRSLAAIYDTYATFCTNCVKFCRRTPFLRGVTFLWSGLPLAFKKSMAEIRTSSADFEAEARLAHDIAESRHWETTKQSLAIRDIARTTPSSLRMVPYSRNLKFCGREAALEEISSRLAVNHQGTQRSCLIHGIGGMGKTQLALEFSYRFKQRFPFVFWIRAQDEHNLAGSISNVARALDLVRHGADANQNNAVSSVRQWLCSNTEWLLVFDNVEVTTDALAKFWPPCDHGAIILTSQIASLKHQVPVTWDLHLESLDASAGGGLLLSYLPDRSEAKEPSLIANAAAISHHLGGLPLLLVSLSGSIYNSYLSLTEILAILRQSGLRSSQIFADEPSRSTLFQYERPTHTVFRLALDTLPAALARIVDIMAMLAPDAIPEHLFLGDLNEAEMVFVPPTKGDARLSGQWQWHLKRGLTKRHLVEYHQPDSGEPQRNCFSIHRSLQLMVLDSLAEEARTQQVFDQAVALIRRQLPRHSPYMVPLYHGWDLFEMYLPHALSLRTIFLRSSPALLQGTLQFAELLCTIGPYLYERGLHEIGSAVLSTAEEICTVLEARKDSKKDGGLETPEGRPRSDPASLRANAMAYKWGLWTAAGGIRVRAEAHVYAKAIVALREKHNAGTDPKRLTMVDHILLANAYGDLAFQYLDEGRYGDAESLIHRSTAINVPSSTDREAPCPSLPQFTFATPKKDLALVRLAQGRQAEALALCREANDLIEAGEGVTSASTQLFRFMSAVILYNAAAESGVGAARALHESVLASRIARFGERGCVTLHSRFWVALCCWRTGEYQLARESVVRCLGDAGLEQWPEECAIRARYLFSLILLGSCEREEGESLLRQARSERDALLTAHAPELLLLRDELQPGLDEFVLFDHLVNTEAGRASIGRLGSFEFA